MLLIGNIHGSTEWKDVPSQEGTKSDRALWASCSLGICFLSMFFCSYYSFQIQSVWDQKFLIPLNSTWYLHVKLRFVCSLGCVVWKRVVSLFYSFRNETWVTKLSLVVKKWCNLGILFFLTWWASLKQVGKVEMKWCSLASDTCRCAVDRLHFRVWFCVLQCLVFIKGGWPVRTYLRLVCELFCPFLSQCCCVVCEVEQLSKVWWRVPHLSNHQPCN